jgi:hypothetical protein
MTIAVAMCHPQLAMQVYLVAEPMILPDAFFFSQQLYRYTGPTVPNVHCQT